ncbi:MAG: ABC transporter substrate-binding protein, partial [Chloroflexota bacterium]
MHRWLVVAMALMLASWLGPVSPANAFKGTVTIGYATDPPTMDPNITSDALGFIVWGWAYDTLMKYDLHKKEPTPWLAEKWEKLSPTSIKFWLRKDAKFSDGSPVTSRAVQYTMERIFDPEIKSRQLDYFQTFKSFEIIDDHTFIWHQKTPDNGLFGRLHNWFLIINPKTKGADKADVSRNTYGGGPYILKSWTKGSKMVFEANPTWWGNSRYPNRPQTIVLRPIRESTTRVKALIAGEVDFIQDVEPQFIPEVEKDPDTRIVTVPGMRIFYLAFATRHGGPFADPKVRQAVNYVIDADLMGKTIMGGLTDPFHMLYHPWSFSGYNPDLRWHGYDLAKAKALMKEAGYPNGFKAVWIGPSGRFAGDRQT